MHPHFWGSEIMSYEQLPTTANLTETLCPGGGGVVKFNTGPNPPHR